MITKIFCWLVRLRSRSQYFPYKLSQKCAIPVFEGLLPEPHNSAILRLLFVCAHWHGLAKLRMHTDLTLDIMDDVTTEMGVEFRAFSTMTCSAFSTQELPRETAARRQRALKKRQGKNPSADPVQGPSTAPSAQPAEKPDTPRLKRFNLQTYKYHSLGDTANTIRRYGTSDSFSTEPVSVPCHINVLCADRIDGHRVNLSTVRQKLVTNAQTKRKDLLDNWLRLSGGRPVSAVSEQDYPAKGNSVANLWVVHRMNTIILVFRRIILTTLAPFSRTMQVILLHMCEDPKINSFSANAAPSSGLFAQVKAPHFTPHFV